MEQFVKLEAEVIEITKKQLKHEWENDICGYFDCEWPDASWMSYNDGYIILDCCSGGVFFLKIVK